MQTDYHIDDLQHVYFVISSFDELLDATQSDFRPFYERLKHNEEQYSTLDILPTDTVYTHGTQDYMKSRLKAWSKISSFGLSSKALPRRHDNKLSFLLTATFKPIYLPQQKLR